jgi:hypothetical protein
MYTKPILYSQFTYLVIDNTLERFVKSVPLPCCKWPSLTQQLSKLLLAAVFMELKVNIHAFHNEYMHKRLVGEECQSGIYFP